VGRIYKSFLFTFFMVMLFRRAGQGRAGQGRAGQGRAGQGRAGRTLTTIKEGSSGARNEGKEL